MKSELTGKNKLSAIGSLAVPVLAYSFGILNWIGGEIQQLHRKTKKMLVMGKIHHPRTDVDRLYVAREKGGRGLLHIEKRFKSEGK